MYALDERPAASLDVAGRPDQGRLPLRKTSVRRNLQGYLYALNATTGKHAIRAVLDGSMHATVRNSSCRIHGGAIVAGSEAALAPKKAPAAPPKQIVIDGPIVTRANAPGLLWMEDHFLI